MLFRRAAQNDVRFARFTTDSFVAMAFAAQKQIVAAASRDDLCRLFPTSPVLALVKDVLLGTFLADKCSKGRVSPHHRSEKVFKHTRDTLGHTGTDNMTCKFNLQVTITDLILVRLFHVWKTKNVAVVSDGAPTGAGGPTSGS